MVWSCVVLLGIAAVSAHPTDFVIRKEPGLRYQYMRGADGVSRLVDTWLKTSNLVDAARYTPDSQNVYHLYTRANPTVSQTLRLGDTGQIWTSNFHPHRRTVVLVHGWLDNVHGDMYSELVPAFLSAEDLNIIAVDWSAGGGTINYATAVVNTVTSGQSVARFINWLNQLTDTSAANYHLVGFSLGGHQVGIIGRNVNGNVVYITSLDPAFPGWITNGDQFRATDGAYTEVIHTNVGAMGYITPLGHVDFYPNTGANMPGCSTHTCDHDRYPDITYVNTTNGDRGKNKEKLSFYYLSESVRSGGFTGTQCATYAGALTGTCFLQGRLTMGGLVPKTGASGIYYLETNASPPFSRG